MRKIIVLSNQLQPINQTMTVSYVNWLVVPSTLVSLYANPVGTTAVPGAGTAELAAIQSGSVLEQPATVNVPIAMSQAVVGNYLINRYNDLQNALNAGSTMKNYATTYWDGTSWFNVPA